MPEGHSVRRLARQFGDVFGGRRLSVSSPQGRFSAGAALLDGHTLLAADAPAMKSGTFPARDNAHFVYKRDGLPCRVCGTTVLAAELVGRKLYWCPYCQQS